MSTEQPELPKLREVFPLIEQQSEYELAILQGLGLKDEKGEWTACEFYIGDWRKLSAISTFYFLQDVPVSEAVKLLKGENEEAKAGKKLYT